MVTWFWLGFMVMGCAIWFMFINDKTFAEEEEFTDENVMKHEVKTAGSLLFLVAGGYIVVFMGLGMFLRFLFTPW